MPNLYTPTDEEATTLLDGVETEADAGRKGQMMELLGRYRDSKQAAGLEPFKVAPAASRAQQDTLNGLYSGLDQVETKLPVEARGAFSAAVEASADRDEAKARMVNQAWVTATYPQLAGSVDADWNATKRHVAKQLWGSDVTDLPDTALYGQIGAHLTKQKAETDMLAEVLTKVQLEAAKGTGDWLAAWKKSATGISANPAWNSLNHDRYRGAAERVWNETQEKLVPLRPAITIGQQFYKLAAKGDVGNAEIIGQARQAFLDELMRLPKDQRETALDFAIAGGVDLTPKPTGAEGAASPAEKLAKSAERAIGQFPQDVLTFGRQALGAVSETGLLARHAYYGEADTPASQLYQQQELNERVEYDRKITQGLVAAVDPIKSKSRIMQGIYDTPQSLVYMAAAATTAGIPLTLMALAEQNRQHFVDNGVPPAEAATLAFAAAVPQVAIERLQANMLFKGKLPGFEKYLTKAVGSKLALARKLAVVAGIETISENAEEALQDITIPVYQEMGAMLSEAVPEVKWKQELAQYAGERVDTFFALLPLVLVGTGTASFKEAAYGRQYLSNKTVLMAAGFTDQAAETIAQTAVAGDVDKAQELVQSGWTDPALRPAATKEKESAEAADDLKAVGVMNTEEQQRAFDELDAQMKASWTEQANPQGARAVRQEDGTWVVVDSAGALVDTAQTPEAALTLVEQADRAEGATLDNVVDDMIAYFKDRGRGGPIEKTGDIKTLQDEVEAGRMTQHQADSVVKLYVDLGTLPANTQADTARLYGESERVYNAKKKIYEYVSRLHDGADPLVLVEEESESYLKEALDRGEFTIEDIEKWQQAVGGKLPKYADEKLRRRGAVEFFSHYAQAYLTAKIQQENTAAVPLSVRRWLGKMKRVFAQIFQLAKNLIDLEDAGKLPAEFKKHLARAVGLDEAFLERRAREEERAEAGKTEGPELLEWVKGKLPHPGDYTGSFAGELRDIYDNLTKEVKVEARGVDQMAAGGKIKRARAGYKQVNKSTANAFFAKPGADVDLERVAQAAREMGYEVEDVNDLLVAVDNSFRGNLSYSNPQEDEQVKAGDESAARRAASVGGERSFALKPKKDQSRDMFDEGLADEDFALTGGTAEDASGAVDREEARREAKRKADEAQGEMTLEERADAYVAAVGVPEAKRDEATFALKKLLAVAEDTQLELGGDYQPRTKEQQRLDELHDQAQAELGMSPQRAAQANVLTGDRGGIEASVETWKAAFGKDDRISAIIPALVRDPMKKWDIRGAIIKTPKDAAVLMQVLRTPYLETMKFIFLDGKNRVIHSEIGTIGTTTSSLAAPNVIARMLDRAGKGLSVRRVIIAHNHPSGDPAPSAADVQVTRQLNDATKSVGFELVDHIVTNGETYYSFAEQGMVSGTYTASKRGLMGKAKVVGEDAQGGGLPSPVLGQAQPWETVKMANLRVVNRPELAQSMLNVLKQVDPTALHVFYLNRKNRMLGLERITNYAPTDDKTAPAAMDPIELNRRIFEGIGRNGATAFIVAFPEAMGKGAAAIMALRQLREFSKAVDVELLDALGPVWEMGGVPSSARQMGVLESAGRASVETDPAKIAADRADYDRLQAEMKTKAPLSPEYNALWQQSEDVKNRHRGFVPGTGDTTFSLAPAFYSRLTRTVEQSDLTKASGAQWKATIRNSKLGVNRDEFDLVSVGDLEDGKTYTKQEVLDYLRANEVKVEDVTLGEGEDEAKKLNDDLTMKMAVDLPQKAMAAGMSQLDAANLPARLADGRAWVGSLPESIQADAEKFLRAHEDWTANNNKPAPLPTHFSQYVLPGAVEGSYREVLLTVPVANLSPATHGQIEQLQNGKFRVSAPGLQDALFDSWAEANAETERLGEVFPHLATRSINKLPQGFRMDDAGEGKYPRFRVLGPGPQAENRYASANTEKEAMIRFTILHRSSWKDGHSQYDDVVNPIVRLRTNERQTADGKRMLFLEEVQAPQKSEFEKMPALFQKNWRQIAFKWALRKAAEGGFDAIGWTTGEQQAERYDLSKQVSRVVLQRAPNSTGMFLQAFDHDGRRVVDKAVNENELDTYIGKDAAAKMVAQEWKPYSAETSNGGMITQEHKILEGLDLKVGGHGLSQLYDQDFRNVVNGLPAMKRAGQKVGTASVSTTGDEPKYFSDKASATRWAEANLGDHDYNIEEEDHPDAGQVFSVYDKFTNRTVPNVEATPVHSLALTPAIRDSVMGGQATFSLRQTDTPAFKAWFGASKVVDDQGKPRVVYHGTPAQFTEFRMPAYFTASRKEARDFGDEMSESGETNVMPVFLRLENPLIVRAFGDFAEWNESDVERLKADGYDGAMLRGSPLKGGDDDLFVVFEPTQIKSATGNRGTFDAENPDITMSIGPMDQSERVRQAMRPRMIPIRIKASDNFADEVKAMVGLPKYEVRGMDVNEKAAKKIILEHDGDMAKLLRLLSDPTQTMHPATKVALAFFMAETANKVGDYAAAADIAKQAAEAATAAGQGVNELKRWSIFSQPETAQQLLQTEIERENNRRKEREPAINAVVTVYADVQREARKLLKKWIDEINGVTAENRKPIDVSSLPDVTFSLSAEQRASGIVRVVAQMLKDSGADAVEAALLAKYGDKVEPHLTDILIEAQKSLTPRRAAEGKRFKTRQPVLGDAQIEQTLAGQRGKVEGQIDLSLDQMKAKGMTDEEIKAAMDAQRGRQGEQQTLGVEGTPRPGMTEAEIEAAMAEERALSGKGEAQASLNEVPGFENRLIDEMMQRLGAANVVVPRGIRDQITELLNMRGLAASEDDVKRIIGAGRLLPNMSPTQAQELADFAKRIGSTPLDSFERAQQTMELFSYVHDQLAPYDLVDVAFGLWYANVLSSLITSARNVTGNAGFLFLDETADMIFRNPTTYWEYLTRLSESVQSGLETAAPAAKNAMVRGQEGLQRSRSLDDERRQGVLESKKAPLEGVRRISRLATRFLSMQDLLFANTAYEMKARQIAYDQAVKDAKAGKIKEKDIAKQVTRELNESTEQIQTFADRAEKEWGNLHPEVQAGYDKANWVKRRTAELRLFERRHELVGRALDFAQKVTLDFQPEGMMGLLMGNLSRVFAMAEHAAQDIQNKPVRLMTKAAAKYGRTRVIPFMRVPVNVFNRALDYGPVGYGRALMDAAGIPILLSTGKTKTRTADERADLLKRATLGTLAMLPLALLCRPPEPGDEPEEFPWLQIHGAGSGTPATNLAQNGPKYRPYSLELQVGGKKLFIDYRMAPIAPYLAAIGALHDRTRYAKQMAEKTALVQGWILAQSMKEAFMSSSPITSLRELSEAAAENTPMSERSINRTLARATAGMAANIGIPLAGLWRSLDQLAGGDRNTRDTLLAASIAEIPVASRLNVPSLDTLGDPLTARTGIGWLADWQTMETPEARIYLAFAQKDVSPTDISPYQSKMTPEDFYAFAKLRGQYLKDELLGADEDGQTGLQRLNGLSDKPREAGEDSPAKKFLGRLSHNATRRALHDVGHEGEP